MENKRVLILAYDYAPYNSIAAQRPGSWFKYFKEYGIAPTVITLHWDHKITNAQEYIIPSFKKSTKIEETDSGTVIRVPFNISARDRLLYKHGFEKYALYRRVLSLFHVFARYLSLRIDSTSPIYREAQRQVAKKQYDFILATGEPFILFKYAARLSATYGIPWVADYRDCWSNAPGVEKSGTLNRLIARYFFSYLEKKYIRSAALITTPSPSYKKKLEEIHRTKKIKVVYNGSDIDETTEFRTVPQRSDLFEIAYAGRFYPHQRLEMFLEGYRDFILQKGVKDTRAVFYGLEFYPEDKKRLFSYDESLNKYLVATSRIPYGDLLKKLREAHLLLLLTGKGIDWLNAKIFDYLPLDRKVLLICNDEGILEQLLEECHGGIKFGTAREVTEKLVRLHDDFLAYGEVAHQSKNFEKYSRKNQAKQMALLIQDYGTEGGAD